MRDIKFRAWDTRNKKMHSVCRLGLRGFSHEVCSPGQISCKILQSDSTDIMQYTGLNDMNGVKIYEGDVVKCNSMVAIVKFLGGVFYGRNGTPLNQWYTKEVIGNVHQNPELIKEQKLKIV